MSFWNTKELFQILPFYNILIEKPKIKDLSNIKVFHELPFYDELSIVKDRRHLKDMQEVIKLK